MKSLKEAQQAALFTSLVSLGLAIAKIVVGFFSGALVLVSDGLESATDVLSGLASYFGLRLAQKQPDERFPYGYYKAENLASLFISLLIMYAAVMLLVAGYRRIFAVPAIAYPTITLAVALFSSLIAFLMFGYLKKRGEETNSQSLIVSSKDKLKDVFASIVVFTAILLSLIRVPYVEGLITMGISLLILRIGLGTAKDAVYALMDVSPSKELESKVKRIISSVPGVLSLHKVKLRKAGPYVFGEAHVLIRKSIDVKRAHEISEDVENKIRMAAPVIESFTIHIEPYKSDTAKLLIPIGEYKGLDSEVNGHFARADHFLFVQIKGNKVDSYYVKENQFVEKKVRAGLSAANEVVKENIDAIVLQKIGEISFHTLRDNLVEIYFTNGKTAQQVIDNYLKEKLKLLKRPTHSSDK